MSASTLSTARPSRAAIAWVHNGSLYCEIPCKDGAPWVIRERCTTDGLTRALNVLIEHADEPLARPPADPNAGHPSITKANPRTAWANDSQRAAARAALKRFGVT